MTQNPGSFEAADMGCTCPVLDNGYGRGCGRVDENGKPQFWITDGCPLHAPKRPTDAEHDAVLGEPGRTGRTNR